MDHDYVIKEQNKRKVEFLNLLEDFIKKSEIIDKETPWSVSEPSWWLKMTDIQKDCIEARKKIK